MASFLFIFLGIMVYWAHFGWTITTEPSWGLFWSVVPVVLGLITFLKTRAPKHH